MKRSSRTCTRCERRLTLSATTADQRFQFVASSEPVFAVALRAARQVSSSSTLGAFD